ncbi:MAG: MFS transporter [Candidatus Tectomicrobia bacterium]|uniref:MFS transporter n=1 Tax=Tectimicrobiota bacterium TaxID=2528274 RepID=A0A938B0A8_UNCTE|nr:MFS transporter [Candidatus Tectomicrobia bacterium]
MPRALLIVSAAVALSLLGDQMIYVVLPVVHETVGVPIVWVGILLSANRWVRLVTNTLASVVVARWGRLWPFVLALFLGGLTTLAYGVVSGVGVFLIARLLWGTSWSFIRLEGLSTALDVASEHTRGRYLGLYQSISRLGGAVAMLAGGILHDLIGFRATFILFGILTCTGAVVVYYERTRREARASATQGRNMAAAALEPQPSPVQATAAIDIDTTTRWRMAVASLNTFSNFLVTALVSATLGYVLRQRFGTTITLDTWTIGVASVTGLVLSTKGFLDLAFAPVAGRLADRWGRNCALLTAMPVAMLALGALALQPPLWVLTLAVLVLYVASTSLHVTLDAVASDIVPPGKRRAFLSLFVTWQDLGSATGPLLGYWIAPHFGLVGLYCCGVALLVLGTGLYLTTFVRSRQPMPVNAGL